MTGQNYALVTDSNGSSLENAVLKAVEKTLSFPPFSWNRIVKRMIGENKMNELHEASLGCLSHEEFKNLMSKAGPLDKEKLLRYSNETNPALYESLQRSDIAGALWAAYEKSIFQRGIHTNLNYTELIKTTSRPLNFCHVVEVFFHYNLVAPDFVTAGFVPYHMIGRGFIAEGARYPVWDDHNSPTGNTAIILPVGLVKQLSTKEQVSYCNELLNHEIVGHHFGNLQDHDASEVKPEDCIMSVPASRNEFVELAKKNRGFRFCGDCKKNYNGPILS